MQGKFESKADEKWSPGERTSSIRQMDNLHVEGSVDYTKKTMAVTGNRASIVKHADNLQVRGVKFSCLKCITIEHETLKQCC